MTDNKITKEWLLVYESPRISDFIWFSWGQRLMARYIVHKVNRKLKRVKQVDERVKFLSEEGVYDRQ